MIVTKEQALKMYCCQATDATCMADECMAFRQIPQSIRIINARSLGDNREADTIAAETADQYYCGLVGVPSI